MRLSELDLKFGRSSGQADAAGQGSSPAAVAANAYSSTKPVCSVAWSAGQQANPECYAIVYHTVDLPTRAGRSAGASAMKSNIPQAAYARDRLAVPVYYVL